MRKLSTRPVDPENEDTQVTAGVTAVERRLKVVKTNTGPVTADDDPEEIDLDLNDPLALVRVLDGYADEIAGRVDQHAEAIREQKKQHLLLSDKVTRVQQQVTTLVANRIPALEGDVQHLSGRLSLQEATHAQALSQVHGDIEALSRRLYEVELVHYLVPSSPAPTTLTLPRPMPPAPRRSRRPVSAKADWPFTLVGWVAGSALAALLGALAVVLAR